MVTLPAQGLVPSYLKAYFNYITSLGFEDIPDYEYLMMVLDSGVTGRAPSRQPHKRALADFPTAQAHSCDPDFSLTKHAEYATWQLSAAAAAILPDVAGSDGGDGCSGGSSSLLSHKRAASDMGEEDEEGELQPQSQQQQQQHVQQATNQHKRLRSELQVPSACGTTADGSTAAGLVSQPIQGCCSPQHLPKSQQAVLLFSRGTAQPIHQQPASAMLLAWPGFSDSQNEDEE